MDKMLRGAFLQTAKLTYYLIRPLLFRRSAQQAHEDILCLLEILDNYEPAQSALRAANRLAFAQYPITVGGVRLPHPFILAAGFVKGKGFEDEATALDAIRRGENIIPGWRTIPNLVGPVELGSFTRWPRMGNSGTVMWRDPPTYSTQNRVGLRNPGAHASAAFLALHRQALPDVYGVNIAVSPGVNDPEQEKEEIIESIGAFITQRVCPAWFTLNLSCPNTEDDPGNHQTETNTRDLCGAAVEYLRNAAHETGKTIPLWVKVGPGLSESQYQVLAQVFHEVGVQAVIATNTLPAPSPSGLIAGVGGGMLHEAAIRATALLAQEVRMNEYAVDIIGCGGVIDPISYHDFARRGAPITQYWSAMVYRGPLAAAFILNEVQEWVLCKIHSQKLQEYS